MGDWLDISTAPRDGTVFQAWATDGRNEFWETHCRINPETGVCEVYGVIEYDEEGWITLAHHFHGEDGWALTHWMPLPTPPASQPKPAPLDTPSS